MTLEPRDPNASEEPTTVEQLHVATEELINTLRLVLRLAVTVVSERLAATEGRDLTRYAVLREHIDRVFQDQEFTNASVAAKLHQLANHMMGAEEKIHEVSEFSFANEEVMQTIIEEVFPLLARVKGSTDADTTERK